MKEVVELLKDNGETILVLALTLGGMTILMGCVLLGKIVEGFSNCG